MDFRLEEEPSRIKLLDAPHAVKSLPQVFMPLQILQKIQCYTDLCGYEINGLGTVKKQGNNFIITEVFILKQRANGVHVKIDPKALNIYIYQLVSANLDPSAVKFQWHSHVNMPVFFSPEDKGTIDGYMNDYMISLVINKAGQYKCRVDLYKPFYIALEVPVYVLAPPLNSAIIAKCQDEIRENVTIKDTVFGTIPTKKAAVPGGTESVNGPLFEADNLATRRQQP